MIRFLGHHVPFEMLCLWVLEVGVLSALICALMLADVPPSGAMTLSADVLNSAVVLAATVGATTFAIGLYRPEVFLKIRRLRLADDVPLARSRASSSSTFAPRPAASRAMPAPLTPPPITARSKTALTPAGPVRGAGGTAGRVR